MAITAALATAAVVGAGAGVYGAVSSSQAQGAANKNNAAAMAENRRQNTQNATVDMLNTLRNGRQQALDNQRYDEAKRIEDAQRELTNRIATATQQDADGNTLSFDRTTGTWRVSNVGVGKSNADRRRTQTSLDATRALESSVVGGQQTRDRMVQGGIQQSQERALGDELLNRYRQSQGRTPQQMEGAAIEKNVAGVMDPLQRGGDMAMLAGYRQGNSGNDALLGSLARQGSAGTRSAIASARYDAPLTSLNERDAAAKSILGPATTLIDRGTAAPGTPASTFSGDASSNLLASIAKTNPAGVGTTLNPRSGGMIPVNMKAGANTGFTPLNATGNMGAGISESLQSILRNPLFKRYLGGGNADQTPYTNYNDAAPTLFNGPQTGSGYGPAEY
jgi:hypothetical protein